MSFLERFRLFRDISGYTRVYTAKVSGTGTATVQAVEHRTVYVASPGGADQNLEGVHHVIVL